MKRRFSYAFSYATEPSPHRALPLFNHYSGINVRRLPLPSRNDDRNLALTRRVKYEIPLLLGAADDKHDTTSFLSRSIRLPARCLTCFQIQATISGYSPWSSIAPQVTRGFTPISFRIRLWQPTIRSGFRTKPNQTRLRAGHHATSSPSRRLVGSAYK